ncbi:hypothetical protein MtrunA17_Chr2g0320861 [Medicago truncatula]|uniref:Uncharacterized protein n=1 Tax=Medicago truncatula TaxID=3880 RepID=A0A396JE92_MEDTR|nr:hypothetical protein MtrunA17_Chr2g0320861 [Medicago truncatula]
MSYLDWKFPMKNSPHQLNMTRFNREETVLVGPQVKISLDWLFEMGICVICCASNGRKRPFIGCKFHSPIH